MERLDKLAREAYVAYGEVTDFKNYQGEPMPEYEELGETIQRAWRVATATAILAYQDSVDVAIPVMETIVQGRVRLREWLKRLSEEMHR